MNKLLLSLFFTFFCSTSWAFTTLQMAYGQGDPANLRGALVGVQWQPEFLRWEGGAGFRIGALLDGQAGYWQTNDYGGRHEGIGTLSGAPLFRVEKVLEDFKATPYFEAGLGLALYTNKVLATQALGGYGGFENKIGVGVRLGDNEQYALSYHYLHFHHKLFSGNDFGANWLLTFAYYFS